MEPLDPRFIGGFPLLNVCDNGKNRDQGLRFFSNGKDRCYVSDDRSMEMAQQLLKLSQEPINSPGASNGSLQLYDPAIEPIYAVARCQGCLAAEDHCHCFSTDPGLPIWVHSPSNLSASMDSPNGCDIRMGASKSSAPSDHMQTGKEVHIVNKPPEKRKIRTKSRKSLAADKEAMLPERKHLSASLACCESRLVGRHEEAALEELAEGQTRRKRTNLTPKQIRILQEVHKIERFPKRGVKVAIAKRLGLDLKTVQVWFQNQRQKQKNRAIMMTEYLQANMMYCSGFPMGSAQFGGAPILPMPMLDLLGKIALATQNGATITAMDGETSAASGHGAMNYYNYSFQENQWSQTMDSPFQEVSLMDHQLSLVHDISYNDDGSWATFASPLIPTGIESPLSCLDMCSSINPSDVFAQKEYN